MKCPKCESELRRRSIQDVNVDECEQCEGIWFEKDELRKVKDLTDSDLNWMDFEIWEDVDRFKTSETKYKCPSCSEEMHVLQYADTKVDIDFCQRCSGIWLDKGELEKIIDALEKELLTKSPSDYVKATLEEAKELLTGPESFLSEWKDFSTVLRMLQYRILSSKPELLRALSKFQSNPLNQ